MLLPIPPAIAEKAPVNAGTNIGEIITIQGPPASTDQVSPKKPAIIENSKQPQIVPISNPPIPRACIIRYRVFVIIA